MQSETDKRLLAEFVDREKPLKRFCDLLESPHKHIMVIWGESGIGKSSLILRMKHECALRELRKAQVLCMEGRPNDYIEIMRKIRDDVGLDHFNPFSDLVKFLTEPDYQPRFGLDVKLSAGGPVSVADRLVVDESSVVGDIGGAILKDNMFVLPRTDMAMPEAERMVRLTERFIYGLKRSVQDQRLVVFIEGVEKIPLGSQRWLWDELLCTVRDGSLTNVKFVLCGESAPQVDRDWRVVTEEAELKPLGLEHIVAYLAKRDVDEPNRQALATFLLANTKGKISLIAEQVDAFLKLQDQMKNEDD